MRIEKSAFIDWVQARDAETVRLQPAPLAQIVAIIEKAPGLLDEILTESAHDEAK